MALIAIPDRMMKEPENNNKRRFRLHPMRQLTCFGLIVVFGIVGIEQAIANELQGSEWRPVEIAGKPVEANTMLFVQFGSGGKLSGHGGCNRISGRYELTGAQIAVGPIAATRKACQPDIMDREALFIRTLEGADRFTREKTDLILIDDRNNALVRFVQTDWD